MINKFLHRFPKLFWALVAALFFLPFLGGVHLFDWDEVNFAEIAREMLILDNYLQVHINYVPFTEKPPGFFWLQALSMNLFGIGEFAARFPNALFGIITLPTIYFVGKKLKGHRFGLLWALAYFGSILPNLYFKSGIIDPVFNFFIFMGIVFLYFFVLKKKHNCEISLSRNKWHYLLLAGVFTGCGMLVKGPVAYLITGLLLAVVWVSKRFKFYIKPLEFLAYTICALAVTGIWYGAEIMVNGPKFVEEFVIRQWTIFATADAGHGGFPGYHFVVLFFGCFPASAFAIYTLVKNRSNKEEDSYKKWMVYLLWVVLVLFTIVQSKIVHYSSMAYFPITYLAAVCLSNIDSKIWEFSRLKKTLLWIMMAPIIVAPIFIVLLGKNPKWGKKILAKDPFAVANLDAQVNWTGFEVIPSLLLLGLFIVSLWFFAKKQTWKASWLLFGGTAVWVFLTLVFFIGKIESYSQRANVEFWKTKADEKCYLIDYKYKTYTDLFYGEVKKDDPPESKDAQYLLHEKLDRPVYISCKINKEPDLIEEIPDAKLLYRKNGFCFYVRKP